MCDQRCATFTACQGVREGLWRRRGVVAILHYGICNMSRDTLVAGQANMDEGSLQCHLASHALHRC